MHLPARMRLANHAGGLEEFAGQCGRHGAADGPRMGALFTDPKGLCNSPLGFLAVVDAGNACIRGVSMTGTACPCVHSAFPMHAHVMHSNPLQERCPTLAGKCGSPGHADGSAKEERFSTGIEDIACLGNCTLLVTDSGTRQLRSIAPAGECPAGDDPSTSARGEGLLQFTHAQTVRACTEKD